VKSTRGGVTSNPCSAYRKRRSASYGSAVLFAAVTIDRGNRRVLSITGDCDLASAPELRRHLTRAAADTDELVVDLSGVGFIDSVGLGLLVGAARRVPQMIVVAPDGTARRALVASRLDQILDIRDS
jgi:anti-sigma B factor antagonist